MGQPFVGEIRTVGFNFAPVGWSLCNGQILSISQNEVLFQLIGTTYGGDGVQTFGLPNLQGRAAIHQGNNQGNPYVIGQLAGTENVMLTTGQLPAHRHNAAGSTGANSIDPTGKFWSTDPDGNVAAYNTAATNAQGMAASAIGMSGGGQPHSNMQPFLAINFIISLFGIFPSQG